MQDPVCVSSSELARDLALRDLSDPTGGPHGLQLLVDLLVAGLSGAWATEVRIRRDHRLVSVKENYDRLGYSPGDVTRNARYSRYSSPGQMLRSHTSAMIPGALDELSALGAAAPEDTLLICPGVCYRRDAIDRWHTGTPHQLDVWRIVRRRVPMGQDDLEEMIAVICGTLAPGLPYRCEPRVHPYTRNGRQVDVKWRDQWVEVAECGLAHPDVLAAAGLAPGEWSGLALGLGLDRLYMLHKQIPDIRLLRSANVKVAAQMLDLKPYRPVSLMPPVHRDLSVAVGASDIEDDLGDRVRAALADRAEWVEEVSIVSRTPYEELPEAARQRLGMVEGQVNLLVRVTLRSTERTLNDAEGNALRDDVYAALHQGTSYLWATSGGASLGGATSAGPG